MCVCVYLYTRVCACVTHCVRSGVLLGRMFFLKISIQFLLIPAVIAERVKTSLTVCCRGHRETDERERERQAAGHPSSDNRLPPAGVEWHGILLLLAAAKNCRSECEDRASEMNNKGPNEWVNMKERVTEWRQSPVSESHSFSPHQTRRLLNRTGDRSLHPTHLSEMRTDRQTDRTVRQTGRVITHPQGVSTIILI